MIYIFRDVADYIFLTDCSVLVQTKEMDIEILKFDL